MHNSWNPTKCFGRNRKQTFYVTGKTLAGEILVSEVFLSLQTHVSQPGWRAVLGQQSFPVPCRLQQGLSDFWAWTSDSWNRAWSSDSWNWAWTSDLWNWASTSDSWNWAQLTSKTAAFLCCLSHAPSQQSPLWAQKPPSMGNTGLEESSDRHCHLSSLWTKINVSRSPDKSLTVSNARNIPYFPFHYEKRF